MGALTKFEPQPSDLAEVIEVDGRQTVRFPDGFRVEGKQFRVTQSVGSIRLEPIRRKLTAEERVQWLADMQSFQAELGDPIPGGRNQGSTKPEEIFPTDFFSVPEHME